MKKRKRVYIKKGDIFKVQITEKKFKCFQYIADDYTQLNSQVIKSLKMNLQLMLFQPKIFSVMK